MMLMKAPTGGGTSTGAGRDVIFRLTVQPDPNAARITREFGEGMTRVHNTGAGVAQQRAKDISDFYRTAFDDVLRHGSGVFDALADRSRVMAGRIASDWSNAMRGIGGPGGTGIAGGAPAGAGISGMNMGALGASAIGPGSAMNMNALARANLTQWQRLASANVNNSPMGPMQMSALAASGGINWSLPAGSSGGASPGIGGGASRFRLEGVNNLLHGGTQLARGVAYSGLVGEQDSQKMVDALLRIEGTLGLIYGAVSIGKGLGGLGLLGGGGSGAAGIGGIGVAALPIAAIVAAVAAVAVIGGAAYEARNEGKTRTLPREGERPGFFARLQQNPFSDLTAGNWWTGNGEDTSDAIHRADWSFGRVKRQEKFVEEEKSLRQWRMGNLASSAATAFGENDRLAEIGMRGVRSDSGRYAALGQELVREKQAQAKLERDIAAQIKMGGKEAEDALRTREEITRRIFTVEEQMGEVRLKGEREAASLAMNRAQHNLGVAQQALSAQLGIAQSGAGRLRADRVRFGQLSPMERMRTEAAFAAVKAGNATKEQEQIAGGYNAFSEIVESKQAQRGGSAWFADAERDQAERSAELDRRVAKVAELTKVVVDQQFEINLKIKDDGAAKDAADQALEIFKELIAQQNRETAKSLDDMRREMANQERKRQIVAGR